MARTKKARRFTQADLRELTEQFTQEGRMITRKKADPPPTVEIVRYTGPPRAKGGTPGLDTLPANRASRPMIKSGRGVAFPEGRANPALAYTEEQAAKCYTGPPSKEWGCFVLPEHAPVPPEVQARADAPTSGGRRSSGWGGERRLRNHDGTFRPKAKTRPGLNTGALRYIVSTGKGTTIMRRCCDSTGQEHRPDCGGTVFHPGEITPRRFDSESRTRIKRADAIALVGEERIVREETLRKGKGGRFPIRVEGESRTRLVLVQTTTKTGRTRCDYFIWK